MLLYIIPSSSSSIIGTINGNSLNKLEIKILILILLNAARHPRRVPACSSLLPATCNLQLATCNLQTTACDLQPATFNSGASSWADFKAIYLIALICMRVSASILQFKLPHSEGIFFLTILNQVIKCQYFMFWVIAAFTLWIGLWNNGFKYLSTILICH